MITARASSTFELYLIKNSQTEDYDLGANLSEPVHPDEFDAFEDVCELYDEIAKELLKDCKGQKKYIIRADFAYETIDCGPDGVDHDVDYTYEVLFIEPSTYFWDIEREAIRKEMANQAKENFENGEFIVQASAYGIKCDNENCGWADFSITEDQYPEYIDRPCPCCGENLLTKEAYNNSKRMIDYVKKVNDWFYSKPKEIQEEILAKSGREYQFISCPLKADGIPDVHKMETWEEVDSEREV